MRGLTRDEFEVCAKLISRTLSHEKLLHQLKLAEIDLLPDGGMGSMRFFIAKEEGERKFGEKVAEGKAFDSDGVPIFLSLLVDREGNLFELEVWRVDFKEIHRFPSAPDLELIE